MPAESAASLRKAIESGRWPSLVLVVGDDAEARRTCVATLADAIVAAEGESAFERFPADAIVAALDAARTRSLFGGRKLVVVQGLDALTGASDALADALQSYLARPFDDATVVFEGEKLDRRGKLAKRLVEAASVVELPRPKERDVPRFLADGAKARGFELPPDAAQLLADAVGVDTSVAARELDKLALVAEPGAPVARQLVEDSLGPARAVGAFALEDALLAGRPKPAIEALTRHLDAAGPGGGLPMLGRLAAVVRRLAVARGVASRGGGDDEVRQALRCHPFVASKYHRAARGVGARSAAALAACVQADIELKSGADPKAALARVVFALTGGGRRGRG